MTNINTNEIEPYEITSLGTETIMTDARFIHGNVTTVGGKEIFVMKIPKSKWVVCIPADCIRKTDDKGHYAITLSRDVTYRLIRRLWDEKANKWVRERTVDVEAVKIAYLFSQAPAYEGDDLVEAYIVWQTFDELGFGDYDNKPVTHVDTDLPF